jgi:hypothetical protein
MNDAENEIKNTETKFLSSLFVGQCTKLDLSVRPLRYWSQGILKGEVSLYRGPPV